MAKQRVIVAAQGRQWQGQEFTELIVETVMVGNDGEWSWEDAKEMAKYSENVAGTIMAQGRVHEVRETSEWERAGMLNKSVEDGTR